MTCMYGHGLNHYTVIKAHPDLRSSWLTTMPRSPNTISNLPFMLTLSHSDDISDDLVAGD
jgi:hypothetical protein